MKAFVGLLSVLEQNPTADWKALLSATKVEATADPEAVPEAREAAATGPAAPIAPEKGRDDDLATFKL